jgi:hypothetical protein
MTNIEDISASIIDWVSAASNKTLLGVRLGILLRDKFTDFSPAAYNCRTLRQFIALHVPAIKESGRSGADITYTIAPALMDQPSAQAEDKPANIDTYSRREPNLPVDLALWKAFSNPSYPYSLATNPQTGEFKMFATAEKPTLPWIAIPKCTSEMHLELAKAFTESLSEPNRTHLRRVLEDPKWFVRFFGILQTMGLGRSWGLHKRDNLVQRFHAALHAIGVVAPLHQPAPQRSTRAHAPIPPASALDEEARVRQLVGRIINTLPIAELRSLRLPLGDVYDAITKGK